MLAPQLQKWNIMQMRQIFITSHDPDLQNVLQLAKLKASMKQTKYNSRKHSISMNLILNHVPQEKSCLPDQN